MNYSFHQQDCEKQVVDSPVEQVSTCQIPTHPQSRSAYQSKTPVPAYTPQPIIDRGALAIQMMNHYATEIVPKLEAALQKSEEENKRLRAEIQRIMNATNKGKIID